MLSLNLKRGDYITVGGNITIRVIPNGSEVKLWIDAPREIPIWRGAVLEEQGVERPKVMNRELPKRRRSSPSDKKRYELYTARLAM